LSTPDFDQTRLRWFFLL